MVRNCPLNLVAEEKIAKKSLCVDVSDLQV